MSAPSISSAALRFRHDESAARGGETRMVRWDRGRKIFATTIFGWQGAAPSS
jgi:hypothetical protein